MNKKFLSIASLLMAATLASCAVPVDSADTNSQGGNTSDNAPSDNVSNNNSDKPNSTNSNNGGNNSNNNPGNSNDQPTEEVKKDPYVAHVVYEKEDDGYQADVTGVNVDWLNKDTRENLSSEEVDNFGEAFTYLDDGHYQVQISNLPDGYAYNPNIYVTDKDNKEIEVTVYPIREFDGKGDGTVYQEALKDEDGNYILDENGYGTFIGGPLFIKELGVYELEITEEKLNSSDPYTYIGLDAPWAGDFTIESWNDASDTSFDPRIEYLMSNFAYLDQWVVPPGQDDNSGEGNNFKISTTVTPNLVKNARMFYRIIANKPGKVIFNVSGIKSDIQEEIPPEYIPVTTDHQFTQTPAGEGVLRACVLDGSEYAVFNNNDGLYHLNSPTGPVLYVRITSPCEWIDYPITSIPYSSHYLATPAEKDNVYDDYEPLVNEAVKYVNGDGLYPLIEVFGDMTLGIAQREGYFLNHPERNLVGWIMAQLVEQGVYGDEDEVDDETQMLWCVYYYAQDGESNAKPSDTPLPPLPEGPEDNVK